MAGADESGFRWSCDGPIPWADSAEELRVRELIGFARWWIEWSARLWPRESVDRPARCRWSASSAMPPMTQVCAPPTFEPEMVIVRLRPPSLETA